MAISASLSGAEVEIGFGDWRAGDQRYFVADASAAREALGLPPPRDWRSGVQELAAWLKGEHAPVVAAAVA